MLIACIADYNSVEFDTFRQISRYDDNAFFERNRFFLDKSELRSMGLQGRMYTLAFFSCFTNDRYRLIACFNQLMDSYPVIPAMSWPIRLPLSLSLALHHPG